MEAPQRRPRGRPPAAAGPLVTRQAVLDAATEHLTRGYGALSMRGLARQLGVSLASVQHHVPTKEALFRAVIDEVVVPRMHDDRRKAEKVAAPGADAGSPSRTAALVQQIGGRARALTIHGGVVAATFDDTSPGAAERRAYAVAAIDADRRAVLAALARHGRDGTIRPLSPELWTALSLLMIPAIQRGAAGLREAGLPVTDTDTLLDELVDLLATGLMPRP